MTDKATSGNELWKYLHSNRTLKISESEFRTNINITANDEIWLVQCPKDINVLQLKDRKIKFPGKSSCDEVETMTEEFATYNQVPLVVNKRVYNLPVQGNVVVRRKLKNVKIECIEVPTTNKGVPFPERLKERHPLLGFDYHDKIGQSSNILGHLQSSKELEAKMLKPSHGRNKSSCEFINSAPAPKNIKTEKSKRRKDLLEDISKAKKAKYPMENEINHDLIWLKDI